LAIVHAIAEGVIMRQVDSEPHRTLTLGAITGLVGATVLALWFLVVDQVAGEPFRTPAMLGGALLGQDQASPSVGLVGFYSAVHLLSFVGFGILLAWAVGKLERAPNLLLGIVVGFVLFNGVFFGSAAVSGIDVVAVLGWAEVLSGNLLAGISMVSFLHLAGVTGQLDWGELLREGRVLREGILSGALAGLAVAIWFLVLDTLQGQPLYTPSALGSALFLGASSAGEVELSGWITLAYSILHFGAFALVGIMAAAVVRQVESDPPLILGGLLIFVAFEAFFLGVIAIAAEFLLGSLAWWSIAVGNLVAVVTLTGWFWNQRPRLRGAVLSNPLAEGRT
jgi:hypothetical protein